MERNIIKKNLSGAAIIIIILLSINFNYDSYKEFSLDEINKIIDIEIQELKEQKRAPGNTIFINKYKVNILLNEYPEDIDNATINKLVFYAKTTSFYQDYGDDFINSFGYKLNYTHNEKKYVFLFQNKLMKYLPKEAKKYDSIDLYIIFGLYSDFDNTIMILVNEFNVLKKTTA